MRREAKIVYVARKKVKGVPHHAKAGNINSCLLKEGAKKGEFILVLDCDMSERREGTRCTWLRLHGNWGECTSLRCAQRPS